MRKPTPSKALDLFDAYHENLAAVTPNRVPRGRAILCPLDLSAIPRAEVESGAIGIEHIVPFHATVKKVQKSLYTSVGVADVRSGLTLTCPTCNGKKGSELDFRLRRLIGPGDRQKSQCGYRTGTAILTMAYLFAFAVFGYEYIFKTELAGIRDQFQDPDGRHTDWLDGATVDLSAQPQHMPVANEWGYPFKLVVRRHQPLVMWFWNFRAIIPSLDGVRTAVKIPPSVVMAGRSPTRRTPAP